MYKVTFLGSKGMIEESSRYHKKRTGIVVKTPETIFQIDCGEPEFFENLFNVDFLVVSHCHPDHVVGLKQKELPVPVVSSTLVRRQLVKLWKVSLTEYFYPKFRFKDVEIQLVSCIHSIRCPMWGVVVNKELGIFTDIIKPRHGWQVLKGLKYYIGDGSAINHKIIRVNPKISSEPFGHTSMKDQLERAAQFRWTRVVFTHLGRQPVLKGDLLIKKMLRSFNFLVARDGLEVTFSKD